MTAHTGRTPELLQDDSRELSRWLASRANARQEAREAARRQGHALLRIVPVTLVIANDFVRRLHRHSRPVVGHKFAIGVEAETRLIEGPHHKLVGVAIVGRPVAPKLDDPTHEMPAGTSVVVDVERAKGPVQ